MSAVILTYEGYALYEWGRGYKSEIDGHWCQFDSAAQWVQYINILIGKSK